MGSESMDEELQKRLEEAADLMVRARYVVALTGAGVSVESGIRPFRGPGGLWTEHGEPPMDGYQRFLADPKKDWEMRLGKQGYYRVFSEVMEKARPNPGHYAMAELEDMGILRAVITQNVDNLHRAAGSRNVAEIHGNILLIRCIQCQARYPKDEISLEVLPPHCPRCGGILKTDGVMFGEPIPTDVLARCQRETEKCDCMLVAGTSVLVYPAASFPHQVWSLGGWLIEVNLYDSELTPLCQVSIRGNFAEIMSQLVSAIKSRRGL